MRVKTGNFETFYQKIGRGPVIVLLHGWGCDWQIWAGLIPKLADNYQLIIPDLPGFGQTKADDIDNWDTVKVVGWLQEFLDEVLEKKTFTVIGHSFGGKIAAVFAATQKSGLEKLILVDSSGIPGKLASAQKFQKKMLKLVPSWVKETLPDSLKLKLLALTNSATDYQLASDKHKELLKTLIAEDIRLILPKIKTPTYIFWGKNDQDTPLANGREFNQLIPNSPLITFDAGHFPFIDKPKEFLDELTKIL